MVEREQRGSYCLQGLLKLGLFLTLIILAIPLYSQTNIYTEDFSTYADGTTSSAQWTTDISGATAPKTFAVTAQQFLGNGVNGEAVWTTSTIDISAYTNVSISLDLSESGNLNADDYIRSYYVLDGGTETLLSTNGNLNGNFTAALGSQGGLSGSTLQLVVRVANNSNGENHYFDNIAIAGDSLIVPTTISTNVSCNGGNDGTIDLSVAGGTAPFTYTWSNSATTQDLSGLTAGTYTVTITGTGGLTATTSVTITEPTLLTAGAIAADESCFGANDGSVNLTASGGTVPYTYAWNNSATSEDISGLSAGSFSVTVTDANGCTATASATVNEPNPITTSITGSDVSCNGGNDGTTDLTVTGDFSPFAFAWSNSATSEDLTNITAGTYSVTVTDNTGCTVTDNIIINEPIALSASIAGSNISCNGGNDGAGDLTVSGGTTPYTFAWSNSATTEDISGLTAGSYNVTVTDANGCTITAFTNLTEPATLAASIAGTDISCNGGNNGAADLTVSGGTAPFTYSWSNSATTEDISGLTIGSYSVTITDANGCTTTASTILNEPTVLSASISGSDASCNGGNDGAADLTVSGGTLPYTYAWSNSASTEDISSITAGSYTVTVTDANGCTTSASTTINEPTALGASFSNTGVTCNGGNDGATDLTVSGGIAPYTFAWSTGATTEDISGLTAGAYNVTITDANGCTLATNTTITEPPTLSTSIIGTDVSCYGGNDGAADMTTTGGTSPYTYLWSNGSAFGDISGLTAGSYTITVTDGNSCTTSASITINEPAVLSASATGSNVSCNSGSDGAVDLTVTGGTTPYTFAWSNSATTEDISSLTAGNYAVTITDANGCTATTSASITEPIALSASISGSNVSCNAGNNGAADLTVAGGSAPYTFAWSNSATSEDLTGLTAGIYTATITDANGCTLSSSVTINEPSALSVSIVGTDVSCNGGNDGAADLTAGGGTSPYTYSWSNGSAFGDISGLAAGNYTVTVTDGNGCTATASITINEPAALSASIIGTDVSCNGGNDGAADLTATGGTSPYTYLWSNGSAFGDISGLTAGSYTVTVTDGNGCTAAASITINEPATLTANIAGNDASCNAVTDGSADLTVTGGTSPYTYSWSNAATSEDISGLTPGSYGVTVTDANGCTATASTTIAEPNPITTSISGSDVTCNGGNDGAADLTVSGDFPPFTFAWSNGATTEDLTGLTAGTYTVTVTDNNGCTTSDNVTINEPTALSASISGTDISCNGGNNGAADLTVSGGTTPYTYAWSNAATTEDISILTAGNYTVTITDANGCTTTASVTLTEPATLSASIAGSDASCNGGNDGAADLTVSGGTIPYSYTWSNGATTEDLSALTAGTYTVTTTDANGCTATDSVTINEPTALSASHTNINVTCNGGNNGSANLTISGGTTPYTYAWSNGATTEDLSTLTAGTYTVTTTDTNGCTITESVTITEPAALATSFATTDVNCNGGNTGSINLTVTGGTPACVGGICYTYLWSTGATTEDISGLTAGTYAVTVTDINSCTTTGSVTINEPAALSLSTTVSNVSCNGGSDGTTNLTVSGGTTPYTYIWSNAATAEDISSLTAGNYTVTVTDANGCTATTAATITEPAALSASISGTDVNCNGGSDGTADLTASGGTSPYTYAWSNAATTEDISGLTAGSYTVTVTDANGCTVTVSATINQPGVFSASLSASAVSCNGGSDGYTDLTVTGGTGALSYNWSNGATTEDISGLTAGTYSVTITDANGCTITGSSTVSEPTTLTASNTVADVSCNGGSDGSVNLTASGGTASYSFAWSNGATTEDISGLTIGSYAVTVTDANGCTATTSATLTEPAALSTSATSTGASCNGSADGTTDLTVTGGTTPYTYLWSNGATTQDLTSVAAGSYTATVTDANGCTIQQAVTVSQPTTLGSSIAATDVTCNGAGDGSVDLTVNNGTPPYIYAWSTGATTEDISGLNPGSYSVTVNDNNGCSVIQNATVAQPATLAAAIAATNECNNNATTDLTVSGGTAPFTYAWSNGGTTEDLTGITTGQYDVTVTDANNCVVTGSVNVGTVISTAATSGQSSCGGADGGIDLTVGGGQTPFAYNWSTGATTEDISGLIAGVYKVTVNDNNGCTVSDSVEVQPNDSVSTYFEPMAYPDGTAFAPGWSIDVSNASPARFEVRAQHFEGVRTNGEAIWRTSTIDISGHYDLTATVDLSATNNLETNDYIRVFYVLDGGPETPFTTNGNLNGNFTPVTASQDITNGSTLQIVIRIRNDHAQEEHYFDNILIHGIPLCVVGTTRSATCYGAADGEVMVSTFYGTPPYNYIWSTGATTEDLSGVAAGTYTLTTSDQAGTQVERVFVVGEPTLLTTSTTQTNVSCNAGSDAAIDLTGAGGTTPYSYNWSTGATTEDVSSLTAGVYYTTITDSNSCTAIDTITITEPAVLTANITDTDVSCNGGSDGTADLTVGGGTTPYAYIWSNGATTEDISGLGNGNYRITVTDANNCTVSTNTIVTQPAALSTSTTTTNECNNDGIIDLTVGGGTSPYTYIWSNAATTEDAIGLVENSYQVTVTDANGCTIQDGASIVKVMNASVSGTDALCNGVANGSADLTLSSGQTPFTYSWSTGATTEDVTGLAAGTYTVTASDNNGCTVESSVTINEPTVMATTASATNALCNGNTDGTGTIAVSGGTAPYGYNWSTGATTQNISSLGAGTYQVTVTDNNGCSQVDAITVNEPAILSLSTIGTNVSCNGGSDGTVNLTVTGGSTPYTYAWDNSATTQDISGLVIGSYAVTVTDANGCIANTSASLTEPTAFTTSVAATDATCNALANGAADLTVSGATAPYTYAWSNGATSQDISTVLAGSYTVTITDANGCITTDGTTIAEPTVISSGVVAINETCNGSDGGGNLTISGGTAPYTYLWSDASTNEDLAGVTIGSYQVTITDANSCTATDAVTVGTALTAGITGVNVSCNGGTDASANLTVTGDYAPYTYAWSNAAITEDISSVTAGTYTVTITDNIGCTFIDSIAITEPAILSNDSINPVDATCNGFANGTIDLVVSGGTPPYSYAWNNGATTEDLSGLAAGTYAVTITDANGCNTSDMATIVDPTPISASTIPTTSCNVDGSIDLTTSGGVGPYFYAWSNGFHGEDLTNVQGGIYKVTITDANGCTATTRDTVDNTVMLSLVGTNANALGVTNGSIDLTVSGGTPSYAYYWSNGSVSQDISNLAAGQYVVTVTDQSGCEASTSTYIQGPFGPGSYIIDMGVVPQTIENSIKPYGLVFELITKYHIPVAWAVKPDKTLGSIDFDFNFYNVGGLKQYKGGPFIIPTEYVDSTIRAVIANWEAKGVVGDYTVSNPLGVPDYEIITSWPKAVIDDDNGDVAEDYLINAEVDSTGYTYRIDEPIGLTDCDEIYIMPHAAATWATHGNLYDWVVNQKKYIWAGCKSGSTLENLINPDPPYQRLNFLTVDGLVDYTQHGGGILPYFYDSSYAGELGAQFLGTMDGATEQGAEQVYIPLTAWNDGAKLVVTTSNGTAPAQGAKMVFGHAYDDPENGMVMYEGGHDLDKCTGAFCELEDNVAAQRIFFNFILMAGLNQRIAITPLKNPQYVYNTDTFSVSVNGGTGTVYYEWTSTCGGTFSDPNSPTTTYTPDPGSDNTNCVIKVVVTDDCGRISFNSTLTNPDFTALPIELLSFEAEQEDDDVRLNWSTATEIDNDYFTIERSKDGVTFEPVIVIPGAGNSSETLNYTTLDKEPYDGLSYYRLKQTDYDGKFSYSQIEAVYFKKDAALDVRVFPNPSAGTFTLMVNNINEEGVDVEVFNSLGQQVFTIHTYQTRTKIDLSDDLASGQYYLMVNTGGESIIEKIFVQH